MTEVLVKARVTPTFGLETLEPLSRAGDWIELEAITDCLVAVTACPQDLNPCNGFSITDIAIVLGSQGGAPHA